MTEQTQEPTVINIAFPLSGEEAARFLAYKKAEFLKNNAEAGRKLMLERLHEVQPTAAETTPHKQKRLEQ